MKTKHMKNKRKMTIIILTAAVSVLLIALWVVWGNVTVEVTEYTVSSDLIPEEFSGMRIAQISDLHNAVFGKNNSRLTELLQGTRPDIIAVTGDSIDAYGPDFESALEFFRSAAKTAPCYYVTGNHESRLMRDEYAAFEAELQSIGIKILRRENAKIERNGKYILIIGMDDPEYTKSICGDAYLRFMTSDIRSLTEDGIFTVLLAHRPEYIENYSSAGVSLALCGHTHGGQVRIPFIGGLIAPGQGFFPDYDAGLFRKGNTSMIVSRGIGNSSIPIRINDRPEIVLVTLQHGEK